MSRRTVQPAYKDDRINVELKAEAEKQLYRDLRAAAIKNRMTLRDIFLPLMQEALARLERRTLLPNQPLLLSKKKDTQ